MSFCGLRPSLSQDDLRCDCSSMCSCSLQFVNVLVPTDCMHAIAAALRRTCPGVQLGSMEEGQVGYGGPSKVDFFCHFSGTKPLALHQLPTSRAHTPTPFLAPTALTCSLHTHTLSLSHTHTHCLTQIVGKGWTGEVEERHDARTMLRAVRDLYSEEAAVSIHSERGMPMCRCTASDTVRAFFHLFCELVASWVKFFALLCISSSPGPVCGADISAMHDRDA